MNGVKSLPSKVVLNGVHKKKLPAKKDQNNNANNSNNINNSQKVATPNKFVNNSRMLESFWKLSEYDHSIRLDGIRELTKYFGTLDQSSNKESYNYVLMRLLKGLASNRKCSRLGYSLALTELISQYESLTFEYVNDLAHHYFKTSNQQKTTNNNNKNSNNNEDDDYDNSLTKEEIRHLQIGHVFVYLCWIQSNRLFKHNLNDKSNSESSKNLNIIKKILIDLNEMRLKVELKTYIQQLYLQALILMIKKVSSSELFSSVVLPIIEQDLKNLFQKNQQINKDNLNLLLTCLNKYKLEMIKFLKSNSLDLNLIISMKNADYFYELISQSSEFLPKLDPVCLELVEYLANNESDLFKDFWLQYLDNRLYSRREPEKKYLGFKLFVYSLSFVNEKNLGVFYDVLLQSNNLLYNFMFSYTNKYNNLNPVCRETVAKELSESIKKLENDNLNLTIGGDFTIKLIEYSKNCHEISDLINLLSYNLNEKSLSKYFDFLINDYLKEESNQLKNSLPSKQNGTKSDNEDEEFELKSKTDLLISKQHWIISQISHLSKNSHMFKSDSSLIKRILTYLCIQSHFESQEKSYGIRMIKNEKIENELNETILEFIGIILSRHESKYHSIIIDIVQSLHNYMDPNNTNNKNGKKKIAIDVKLNEKFQRKANDFKSLCSRMTTLLSNINSSMQSIHINNHNNDNPNHHGQPDQATLNRDIYETFFIIISIECFRMFDSFKNSQQAIDDVEICFEKFTNELKKKTKIKENHCEDEIEWVDVLVELLLNLFSINKHWIRNIAKLQFKKIFPKLTTKSVKLIIDILSPETDRDLLVDDDDEEMDDNCENNDGHDHSEHEESDVEDNDQDEEDEDDDEEEDDDDVNDKEVDQEFKNSLMKSLGHAAIDTENDDAENNNSDLDDDAMMKLDESIASAFKLRKKDQKHEINLIQYKLRALDFIQELMKTTYRLDLIVYLIKPLLEILFESQNKPNLKIVSQRILGFIQNLKNTTKKINESKLPPVNELFELLEYIIQTSTLHFNVINTLVESSMYCVRLIQYSANSSSNETEKNKILKKLTDMYLDIIKNEKSKINPIMYKEYLLRYPSYSIELATQLIDSISSNDVKLHKKTVTMVTLYQCINNQMFFDTDQSGSTALLDKLFSYFYKTIDESISDENLHIKFVDAFLNLVTRVLNLQKNLINKSHLEGLVTKLNVFVKDTKIKQAYKSRFSNLIGICNRSLK